jgi:hypothetical protein
MVTVLPKEALATHRQWSTIGRRTVAKAIGCTWEEAVMPAIIPSVFTVVLISLAAG